MIDSRYVVRDTTYLLIFVILTLPQFISVTISPSDSVTASSPSMNTLGPYHTSLFPTLGFCWMDRYTEWEVGNREEGVKVVQIETVYYPQQKHTKAFTCQLRTELEIFTVEIHVYQRTQNLVTSQFWLIFSRGTRRKSSFMSKVHGKPMYCMRWRKSHWNCAKIALKSHGKSNVIAPKNRCTENVHCKRENHTDQRRISQCNWSCWNRSAIELNRNEIRSKSYSLFPQTLLQHAPSSAPTISSEKICCATKLLLPRFAPSYQTGLIWGSKLQGQICCMSLFQEQAPSSVLKFSLPWHDVSPVGQSNWLSFLVSMPQSGCFVIQLPRRVLRMYWLGYLLGSVFLERVSRASSLVCTGL